MTIHLCKFESGPQDRYYCPICDQDAMRTVPKPSRRRCGNAKQWAMWRREMAAEMDERHIATTTQPSNSENARTIADALRTYAKSAPEQLAGELRVMAKSLSRSSGLYEQAVNWLVAMEQWAKAGFPTRSKEEAIVCYETCKQCPSRQYDAATDRCTACGCMVKVSWLPAVSKPRMATEDCPDGHWPATTRK